MVKKKSRLNQACAAAQAQKSKLAHTQKIKALKQSQQNHHQQKLKLKQQPKLFNPQNQSNSQSNSDLKLTSSTIIKSNYPTINDSALDFDQIHPTQQTEIIPFASSSQSNLIPQQHRIKNASQDQPPRSRKSTSMVDRNDKILLIGEGNFSFATSLVLSHSHPGRLITATTNDSEKIVSEKYPDANQFISTLRSHHVNVIFEVDACNLHKDKRIKNHQFDRVIFNFPHVGLREADMDRNIKFNQILILQFLRSVSYILRQIIKADDDPYHTPLASSIPKPKKNKRSTSHQNVDSSDSEHDSRSQCLSRFDRDQESEDDDAEEDCVRSVERAGSVLITLRTCSPYSLWQLPMLAKRGPMLAHSILYPTHPALNHPKTPQPTYRVIRSSDFHPDRYPGYEHRRTNGFEDGRSTHSSLDVLLPAKARARGDAAVISEDAKARTWEFELDV